MTLVSRALLRAGLAWADSWLPSASVWPGASAGLGGALSRVPGFSGDNGWLSSVLQSLICLHLARGSLRGRLRAGAKSPALYSVGRDRSGGQPRSWEVDHLLMEEAAKSYYRGEELGPFL